MLRTRTVRRAVRTEMQDKGVSRRDALKTAQRYADEIAANYSHSFVSLMAACCPGCGTGCTTASSSHNIDRLQQVAEASEVIYVPCHRSHMDYLLLSYVVYDKGYAVPHIAAGINLNMPVVGSFLRRGGAFFLRRSFGGNQLYSAVFMKYFGTMLARGHSIEYFVEGGRSRTGRLMKPKTGMLAMTVRSYLRDPNRPVVFVPIYFGYERLVEGRTYIGELSGRPKEKESVLSLLKVIPALRSRFGKVYVSFGEPLPLDPLIRSHAPGWDREPLDSSARPDVARTAGQRPRPRDHEAHQRGGLRVADQPDRARAARDAAAEHGRGGPRAAARAVCVAAAPGPVFAAGVGNGHGRRRDDPLRHDPGAPGPAPARARRRRVHDGGALRPDQLLPQQRAAPAADALAARLRIPEQPEVRREDLHRLARRVYPFVAEEYFLRWTEEEVPGVVDELLEDLFNHGLLTASEDRAVWRRPAAESPEAVQLSVLAQATVPILERYYLALALLLKAGSGRLTPEALERQCELMAQRMALLYEINSPEFFDRALFRNFVELLRLRGVLTLTDEEKLGFEPVMIEAIVADAQTVLNEQVRNSILQVVHR